MSSCYAPYTMLPQNPASTDGICFKEYFGIEQLGMKRILDFIKNVALKGEFPGNQFYLLVVDINIYWRLAHWLTAKENLTPWQMSTLLPLLGSWHPLKVRIFVFLIYKLDCC